MLFQPTIIKNVSHPLVASAFVKHRFNAHGLRGSEEILVLDAHRTGNKSTGEVQAAILADMDLILGQVQRRAIKIDSVEIRVHH